MFGLTQEQKPTWPYVLNPESPQARGLVGWWPGDPSGSSKLYDLSGNGNHGTINGTIPSGGVWVPGNGGGKGAIKFDGSTNYVNCGTIPGIASSARASLVCWIYKSSNSVTTGGGFSGGGSTGANRFSFIWFTDGVIYCAAEGVAGAAYGTFSWGTFAPTHLVLTYDGTQSGNANRLKLFLNGSQKTFSSFVNTIPSALGSGVNPFTPGRDSSDRIGGGQQEDWRVYNRPLSATEIWAMYDPVTRWQIRYKPGLRSWFFGGAPTSPLIITTPGAFSFVAQSTSLVFEAIGGFGGGAAGGVSLGGNGASGPDYVKQVITGLTIGNTYNGNVGAAGAVGADGGDSSFTDGVINPVAKGGKTNGTVPTGAVGSTVNHGGTGGSAGSTGGGGGGGSGGSTGAGGNGSAGGVGTGGAGGVAGSGSYGVAGGAGGAVASPGIAPGGGGGTAHNGGAGAVGEVILTWPAPSTTLFRRSLYRRAGSRSVN